MCQRPDPTEYYQPISDLTEEFGVEQAMYGGASPNVVEDTAWVGTTAFRGLRENA